MDNEDIYKFKDKIKPDHQFKKIIDDVTYAKKLKEKHLPSLYYFIYLKK